MPRITAAGRGLNVEWVGEGVGPVLVFLHEGLGSIGQWREFPARLARATGLRALVYDRYGYGQSDVLAEPRVGVDFMHREALEALPEVLSALQVREPVLVGHSDGASIALIHAGAGHAVRGLVLMAPHVFVEDICVESIRAARRQMEEGDLAARLARYHRDPRRTFGMWCDAWLDPAFGAWNIESFLPAVRAPVLAIQGEDDAYGTMAQLEAIGRQVGGRCELVKLPACGHSPHRDQPERCLEAICAFVRGLDAA